jgi:hypothetical protein
MIRRILEQRINFSLNPFLLVVVLIVLVEFCSSKKVTLGSPNEREETRIIEAERFVVRSGGHILGSFGTSDVPGEGVSLKLLDSNGKERINLMIVPANNNEALILLKDDQRRIRLSLDIGMVGEPEIDMYNQAGQRNVYLRSWDPSPGIVISKDHKIRAALLGSAPADEKKKVSENGILLLRDRNERTSVQLPETKTGN